MYINDTLIVFYLLIGCVGLIMGRLVAWACEEFINEKEAITIIDFFKSRKKTFKMQYIFMFLIAGIYVYLLYKFGVTPNIFQNLNLLKYVVLVPMLITAFWVDLKARIIPNRLNMALLEFGILLTFLYGINNIAIAKDMILGLIVGGGIFLIITVLGGLIAGKEAMGLGDVKFMGAVRTLFWCSRNS